VDAGADGVLNKAQPLEDQENALRRVLAGEIYTPN